MIPNTGMSFAAKERKQHKKRCVKSAVGTADF
jgi:hypothetical protein